MKAIIIFLFLLPVIGYSQMANSNWSAPNNAKGIKPPYAFDDAFVKKGKALFNTMCVVCHGNKGKGDGIAGANLKPRPSNLLSVKVQAQTNGELYWKMTTGRPPMAAYKDIMSEEKRWQLVAFIRQLGKK